MSFFKKIFGRNKAENQDHRQSSDAPVTNKHAGNNQAPADGSVAWVAAESNRWSIPLLDLTPVTQKMLATSTNPLMAQNAISYSGDDGTSFWNTAPENSAVITGDIYLPIDGALHAGVLFIPQAMEHKWAIYFDGTNLIFVRSWMRQVFVTAKTRQQNNRLIVEQIQGSFVAGEPPAQTRAMLNFLLISHAIGEVVPAPLPQELQADPQSAAMWAFTAYGNMAHAGTFDHEYVPEPMQPLRSHSLLHIAAARGDMPAIERLVREGVDINARAGDGLVPLQWALALDATTVLEKLLALGADPNGRSAEGATAIMNAVQSGQEKHLDILLQAGADVNARDNRGFTALHRSCEMGKTELTKILLQHGADKTVAAEGHTAASLAAARQHTAILELLALR